MQIKRIRPTRAQLTVHPYELAALIAASRWVADGAEGELPEGAVQQLRTVLESYDRASQNGARPES